MQKFSDKYSLHLAITLQNFKPVSLVNVMSCLVQFAQLVYVTPQCHLHQHALIFHLETVYHLSYQYNINIFF